MILITIARLRRLFLTGLSALIAVAFISPSALAQSDSTPKWDVFGGYQYLYPGGNGPTGTDPSHPMVLKLPGMAKGIGGSVTYNFDRHFGLETDFGYNRDSGSASSEWTAGVGPRLIMRPEAMAFFIHALGRYNRVAFNDGFNTSDGIGAILGGGLDVPFGKMFSWRVFGADYVWAKHNFASLADPPL